MWPPRPGSSASGRGPSVPPLTAACAAWPTCWPRTPMSARNAGAGGGAERDDMGNDRQIDRARAERLLDGTDTGIDPVGRLLAAARAPAHRGELRREAAALGAFREAVGARPAPRRRVMLRRTWVRVAGLPAALALAVAAAGVAVAA